MKINRHLNRKCKATAILFSCLILFVAARSTPGQTPSETYQRSFPNTAEALQAAISTIHPVTRGRLPILDGFVIPQGQPVESYSRGYYECTLQILSGSAGQNIVRAAAKITAWYTDPEASRSGYRVLPSNGRLENDALDRIDEALADATVTSSSSFSSSIKNSSGTPPAGGISRSSAGTVTLHNSMAVTPAPAPSPSSSTESMETIRAHREANEKKAAELAVEEKNLEEILNSQARPTDLLVVKRAATPIFSKPAEDAQVLMSADAHDEFQILELQGAWIHVKISGASRGWIRRTQVNLPSSYGGGGIVDAEQTTRAGAPAGSAFKVEKEETSRFGGKWEPLSGKNVRVVWAAPSSGRTTSASEKKAFAKDIFLKAYSEQAAATPPIEGVVVLFDSADGGQVAATLDSVVKLKDGNLTAASFWRQCSLDPPELFEDAKPASKMPEGKN